MSTVSKTLSWQSTAGSVDYYEIGIATTASGTPTVIYTTADAGTQATIEYESTTYPTAWLFVRAISTTGSASDWSDPISTETETPTYTPPQPLQYAYANDILDAIPGLTIPATITTRMLNKICLAASREIDRMAGRKFSPQTVVEKYHGTGTSELLVKNYPITRINYARVTDGSGLSLIREYDSTDLELTDYETGMLQLKPVAIDNLEAGWQTAASLLYGHVFLEGRNNVEVSYEYGHIEYTEGEELEYLASSINSSSGVTSRTYQAIHHNWNSNNLSVYQNGILLTSGYSVDTKTGIVTVIDGDDDDTITANYFYTVPADIEVATAKLAAIGVANQVAAASTGGVTSFRNMNYQEVYGSKPYSFVVDQLQKQVDSIMSKYRSFEMYAA